MFDIGAALDLSKLNQHSIFSVIAWVKDTEMQVLNLCSL